MDLLLGEVFDTLDESNVLFVISDHGFEPFKWGINLNSWLWRQGYLVIKDGADPCTPCELKSLHLVWYVLCVVGGLK